MTNVLHSFVAHMLANPQVQQKIKNELDNVYGTCNFDAVHIAFCYYTLHPLLHPHLP